MEITIEDVAKKAKVSKATVSRVLNNTSSYIREETKDRVLKAIKEMDYRPNIIAASLKKKKTNTIGVIISNILNPFFTAVVRGIEDKANRHGYNVILCNTDENSKKEREYLQVLRAKQVDGLIAATSGGNIDLFQTLKGEKSPPVVLIDRYLKEIEFDAVVVNNQESAYQATKYLVDLGHKKIAMISAPLLDISTRLERVEGYRKALEDNGIKVNQGLIKICNYKKSNGYIKAMQLLTGRYAPTAIFVTNNLVALGALIAIKEKRLRIPQDISFLMFDDLDWTPHFNPALTTVAQPAYMIGSKSVDIFLKKIRRKKKKCEIIILKTELIIRESCGPPNEDKRIE